MNKAWSALATASLLAGVTAGCATDDGIDVVADGDGAAALIASAASSMTTATGRFRAVQTVDFGDPPAGIEGLSEEGLDEMGLSAETPTSMTMHTAGEFNGSDLSATATMDPGFWDDGQKPDAPIESSVLVVDDVTYTDLAGLGTSATDGVDPAVVDGKKWVSHSTQSDGDGAEPGSDEELLDATIADAPRLLELIESPTELEPVTIDGVTYRQVQGGFIELDLGMDDLGAMFESDDAADEARLKRIRDYDRAHSGITATVLIDSEGALRRLSASTWRDVGAEFAQCPMLIGGFGDLSFTLDVYDLGAEVSIEAPDPATVISDDDLFGSMPFDVGAEEFFDGAEGLEGADIDVEMYDTQLGPRSREGLIGAVESGMFMLGIDAATIDAARLDEKTNEELVAIIDGYIEANGGSVPEVLARHAGEGPSSELFGSTEDTLEGCPA